MGRQAAGGAGDRQLNAAVAFFVSPHGFGHAARASAVIEAVRRQRPDLRPEIFTAVPRWFFEDSLDGPFGWHQLATDVGLMQRSAVDEDPAATVERLQGFYPFAARRLDELADRLAALGCAAVVADISPLGIEAARHAGLPSILVENFTWEWIYRAYLDDEPRLAAYADAFERIFDSATVRLQTEPVCRPLPGSERLAPIRRRPRNDRAATRTALELDGERPLVLLVMGGFGWRYSDRELPRGAPEVDFVAIGGVERTTRRGNLIRVPDRSPVFLPDLIGAADLVVGKLGYSTLAEALAARTRFLCVRRPRFPEYPVLMRYLRRRLPSAEISVPRFGRGEWLDLVPGLLARPRPAATEVDGAETAARRILSAFAVS